ncbi:MAG: division/cell wall cluster transcriptional repressor MraZ, partial [Candidatus Aminicenantes bacterium]|nr:division/cell wall cluster transcriptional repressor MraZ [Candidatus Aminicenantes bacterium]
EEKYGAELYVTSIDGKYARIYPLSEWEEIESKLLEPPKMLAKEKFLRNTSYYGQMVNMDRQGRVLIPPHLRERAEITNGVAVMGSLTYLTLWNRKRFESELDEKPFTQEDEIALADLGL